jgi:uncharacterized membrane protein
MKSFLDKLDHDRIVAAIAEAEKETSGEIRVHIHHRRAREPFAEATKIFEKLGMTGTARRNGVLVFVAPRSRKFAILGDTAIHERCGDAFWEGSARDLEGHFRDGRFTDGLVATIHSLGRALAEHFPSEAGKSNELVNEIDEG